MASAVPVEDMDDEGTEAWAIQTAPQLPNNKDIQSSGTSTISNRPQPLLPMNPFSSFFDLTDTGGPLFSSYFFSEACSNSNSNLEVDRHRAKVDKLMNEINNLRTQVVDSTVVVKKLFKKLSKAKEDLNQTMTGSSLRLKRVQQLEKQREALFAYYNGMLRAPTHDRSRQEQGLPDYLTTESHLKHLCEFVIEKQRVMIRGLKQDEEEGTEQSVGKKSSGKNVVSEAERDMEPLRALFKFLCERLKTERIHCVFLGVDSTVTENGHMATNVEGDKEGEELENEKEEQDVMKQDRELDLENGEESEHIEMNMEEDELDEWKDQLKSPSPDTESREKFQLIMDEAMKDVRDTDSFLNLCVEKANEHSRRNESSTSSLMDAGGKSVFPNNIEYDMSGCSNSDEEVQNRVLGLKNGREAQYIEMNREEDKPNDRPKSPSSNTSLDEMGAFHVLNPELLDTDFILRHVFIDEQNDDLPYVRKPHVGNMGLGFFPGNPELNRTWGFTEPKDFPSSPEQASTKNVMDTSGKGVSPDNIESEMSGHLNSNEQVQNRTGMSSEDDTSPSTGKRSHKNFCRSS